MKTGVRGEKPLEARERTNHKLNSHMTSTSGFEPSTTSVGGTAVIAVEPYFTRSICPYVKRLQRVSLVTFAKYHFLLGRWM